MQCKMTNSQKYPIVCSNIMYIVSCEVNVTSLTPNIAKTITIMITITVKRLIMSISVFASVIGVFVGLCKIDANTGGIIGIDIVVAWNCVWPVCGDIDSTAPECDPTARDINKDDSRIGSRGFETINNPINTIIIEHLNATIDTCV